MNNQLTSIHLSRRLPYGVKGTDENGYYIYNATLSSTEKQDVYWEVNENGLLAAYWGKSNGIKPILRNLGSLTREELIKYGCCSHVDWIISEISIKGSNIDWDYISYEIIRYLLENNFHIDEPEGTFIYAESLDVNPYN